MLPEAIDAHNSEPQTTTVPGDLQYRAGVPAELEVLKGALQTKNYIFIKLPLAANNTSNIPGEKGAAVRGGWSTVQRKVLLPAFSDAHIKGILPRFCSKGVPMTGKEAEVVCALVVVGRRRRGGGGDGEAACTDDLGYNRLFRLRL